MSDYREGDCGCRDGGPTSWEFNMAPVGSCSMTSMDVAFTCFGCGAPISVNVCFDGYPCLIRHYCGWQMYLDWKDVFPGFVPGPPNGPCGK